MDVVYQTKERGGIWYLTLHAAGLKLILACRWCTNLELCGVLCGVFGL
jgi:hypothetical protein